MRTPIDLYPVILRVLEKRQEVEETPGALLVDIEGKDAVYDAIDTS